MTRQAECGKDFCGDCGDCLKCYGGDPCTDGGPHDESSLVVDDVVEQMAGAVAAAEAALNTERPLARMIREQTEKLDADMAARRNQYLQRDGYRVRVRK